MTPVVTACKALNVSETSYYKWKPRRIKKAQRPDNVLKRNFTATRPNEKWLTDITEVPCSDGKLYVAPVLDCFGGESFVWQ